MRGLKPLSIAATLMAAVSAVSANPVPDDLHDDEPEAKGQERRQCDRQDHRSRDGTAHDRCGQLVARRLQDHG